MIIENGIHPFLHTLFSEPYLDDDGKLAGIIVDNKSGRGIIKAKYFIDATGDADLCYRLNLDTYIPESLQPPTMCALFEGWDGGEFNRLKKEYGEEFKLPEGFVWGSRVPNTDIFMLAGTRILEVDCSQSADLIKAEMDGRRQIRAILDMFRKYSSKEKLPRLISLPSYIGIRETRHVKCLYQVSNKDTMYGIHFDDAIANGSYRMDLHLQTKPGIIFRYLNGTEVYSRPGYPDEKSRWREETAENPTYYQVPLRSLIPPKYDNLIVAGRMLDSDIIAYSAIRVMVNMNQLGEAAGVTSYIALHQNKKIKDISPIDVREELKKGGSIIL